MRAPALPRVCSHDECAVMLDHMREASARFYGAATRIGNHAFIEFTGLMNEYIKLCNEAHERGEDFTTFNIHNGRSMIPSYSRDYMREKIECIFGVPLQIVIEQPEAQS